MTYDRPKVERVQLLGQMQAAPSGFCGPDYVRTDQDCVHVYPV